MPEQLPDADLAKARANFERIAGFLAARRSAAVDAAARGSLDRLWGTTLSLCERLQGLLRTCGARPPGPAPADAPANAGGPLDGARVERFADFAARLDGWFAGHDGAPESDSGVDALVKLYAAVAATRDSVSEMLAQAAAATGSGEPESGTEAPAPVPDPQNHGDEVASAAPREPEPAPVRPRSTRHLLLPDLDERPLLQEFRGTVELTDLAKELLTEFLDEHGIELDSYRRHRLDGSVQRWIEATPDGQVLVLKIGGLRGTLEPFPSYVPRDRVEDEISALRGYGTG